ncbi:MAG: OmpH family outer membrane protein [Prevotella sp.]|jgi:outer membrane protein|nr:OmpH family outer membrane protein [Prevotella sp.]MBO7538016.1 OmpH family outer membrane protein [Prevotella sp.]
MKRLILLIFTMVALTVSAQDSTAVVRFGYLNYQQALQSMPQYALVQQKMADLRQQYEAEMQRVTNEFNRKYEEFLEGQHEFPKTILQKRQTELQELMTRNVTFKEESRKQLADAEREALAPLKILLSETVARIASERGLALVVNTASDACPYINPAWGEDLNQFVSDALK